MSDLQESAAAAGNTTFNLSSQIIESEQSRAFKLF